MRVYVTFPLLGVTVGVGWGFVGEGVGCCVWTGNLSILRKTYLFIKEQSIESIEPSPFTSAASFPYSYQNESIVLKYTFLSK